MKYFILFFLFLFLQSCAHLSSLDYETDQLALLDQYLLTQDFSKALKLIAETQETSPQAKEIKKQRKKVIRKLRAYEKETISNALKLERKNEWPAAKLCYETALKKSGHSKRLEDAQKAMLLRFQEKVDALQNEDLIITAEWIQKRLSLLQELHASDPRNLKIKWRYYCAQNDAKDIVDQLLPLGKQMLQEKNLAMARRIIPLIADLTPTPETTAVMKQYKKQLQEKSRQKKNKRQKTARKNDNKHIESFNEAMAHGNLFEAQQHLSQLTPNMQKSMRVELMRDRLKNEIDGYIQQELSAANSFYQVGEYEQAISVWQNIIAIDPDNEPVKSKIERAKVIIEKLQSLRERQTPEPSTD